jgi:hypothetical protein
LSEDIYEALARTALFIELDVFGLGADHHGIIDGLRGTTARIIADRANLDSTAGQTALVTLYAQLAMMGLQIDLDVSAAGLHAGQPPLRGSDLPAALLGYSADLLPGGSACPSPTPDVTFVLGDTPGPPGAVRVSGTGWAAAVSTFRPGLRWRGTSPAGAMAAACAAATEGFRAAVPNIAERLGRPAPSDLRWRTQPDRQVTLDLSRYQATGPITIGDVDIISGGAITNAAVYALLRIPALSAALRVIEPERLALSNLNRYALALRSMIGWPKTTALISFQTPGISITGFAQTFGTTTAPILAPIAPRLLVGVDHIPSRWAAHRAAPFSWACVGASSHDFVVVSAHPVGSACAGCVHTHDEEVTGEIPTISFVSFWAGLIQALELITEAAGRSLARTRTTYVWSFGLENARGLQRFAQVPSVRCPVGCLSSTRAGTAA